MGLLKWATYFISGEIYGTVMTVGGIIGIFISAAAMFLMLRFASDEMASD
ncbi:MAG: hypothetical protein MSJ26_01090 [Oscillospiraceae bacterium]|nr:hypothetical protein [Oscillospiraceae bacterium]